MRMMLLLSFSGEEKNNLEIHKNSLGFFFCPFLSLSYFLRD